MEVEHEVVGRVVLGLVVHEVFFVEKFEGCGDDVAGRLNQEILEFLENLCEHFTLHFLKCILGKLFGF